MKIQLGSTGTLLTITFTVLKLTHVINWSWFWILSPILISLGLTVMILAFTAGVFVMATLLGVKLTVKRK
jgi:hypothetical protein